MLAIQLVSQHQTEDFRHKKRALITKALFAGECFDLRSGRSSMRD
jgi:hypothetical protein